MSVIRPPDGGPVGFLAVTLDVTERRAAEALLAERTRELEALNAAQAETAARLSESEARFRLIADAAPVPMWVTRQDRVREFVNRAYADFLGLPYEEARLFDWRDILHPEDVARVRAEQVAKEGSGQPFWLEARYRRCDGEWRWVRSHSRPPRAGRGA